jgi:hypothetical protein
MPDSDRVRIRRATRCSRLNSAVRMTNSTLGGAPAGFLLHWGSQTWTIDVKALNEQEFPPNVFDGARLIEGAEVRAD